MIIKSNNDSIYIWLQNIEVHPLYFKHFATTSFATFFDSHPHQQKYSRKQTTGYKSAGHLRPTIVLTKNTVKNEENP